MFAVIGRELFSSVDPKRFATLPKSLSTLFQLITLDDWFYMYTDIVDVAPGISEKIFYCYTYCSLQLYVIVM